MRSAIILFSTIGFLGAGCAVALDGDDGQGDDDDVQLGELAVDENDFGATPHDQIAPITTITAAPDSSSLDSVARFEFLADEPASFECSLDGGRFLPCESPIEYAELDIGGHDLRIRATDLWGNIESSPAAWSWRGCFEMSADITASAAVTMCNITGMKGPVNRLAAYINPDNNNFRDTTGWTGYDLSSLPDDFVASAMTVHYFHESGFANPFNDPLTVFDFSTATRWSRDSVTLADLRRSAVVSGRTSQYAQSAWNDFAIDIEAFEVSKAIANDWVTLGITNTGDEYSHVLFFGIEDPDYAPYLEVVGVSCEPLPSR